MPAVRSSWATRPLPLVKREADQQRGEDDEIDQIGRARPSSIRLAIFLRCLMCRETRTPHDESGHRGISSHPDAGLHPPAIETSGKPRPGSRLGNTSGRDRASSSMRVRRRPCCRYFMFSCSTRLFTHRVDRPRKGVCRARSDLLGSGSPSPEWAMRCLRQFGIVIRQRFRTSRNAVYVTKQISPEASDGHLLRSSTLLADGIGAQRSMYTCHVSDSSLGSTANSCV